MSGKKRRPFELQHFTITQEKVSLPVTTDACIFGALTEFQNPKNILDVGCGSGILMFLMHQKYPNAHILGLEKHPESVQTVQENIRFNNTATAMSVQEVDWWNFNPENPVDAIICNPPFFSNHLPSQELSKRNARHTDNYELWQLLVHLSHWLTHEGMLSMLVPYETLGQLEHLNLDKTTHLLFLKQAQTIRAFQDSKPHLAVVHFQKKNCDYRIIEPLIVYDKPNQFTDESKRVLQAFLQERALK
jgi:tRNA1Val (adenine37-N6)-methyltransferase